MYRANAHSFAQLGRNVRRSLFINEAGFHAAAERRQVPGLVPISRVKMRVKWL
jgi:hypothetical protein